MQNVLSALLRAAKTYTLFDFGCLKIALIAFGILLGSHFSEFFLRHTSWLGIVFVISYGCIVYRTLNAFRKQ